MFPNQSNSTSHNDRSNVQGSAVEQHGAQCSVPGTTPSNSSAKLPSAFIPPSLKLLKNERTRCDVGEKFAEPLVTGTSSMTVAIVISHGRSGSTPQLWLSYDSGSGNSLFGSGKSLTKPGIIQKTNKNLPEYHAEVESEVFLHSDAEGPVPVLRQDGRRHEGTVTATGFTIHCY